VVSPPKLLTYIVSGVALNSSHTLFSGVVLCEYTQDIFDNLLIDSGINLVWIPLSSSMA